VAAATGRTVVAGPSEATALGNILVQAMGAGLIRDLKEAREVVRRSFQIDRLEAKPSPEWDRAYDRYRGITGK
jgi:sugar (pentulose or hexulose) kinase